MARKVLPALPEPKFKKQAKVSRTATHLTRTTIEIVPDDPTQPTREGDVHAFLDQALRRFQMATDAENYNRLEGLQDVLMVDGDGQWDDDIRGKRLRKKQPCVTVNRFRPMIAHVANEQRMARPSIQIDPVGGGADPESAQIRQGLIRHIQVTSNAETVYANAFERMIEKGWSWFRVVTDWESPLSHHQVIKIEGFSNDFCVYSDPTAEDPTRKDMKWAFIVYNMPRGEYLTQYRKSKAAGLTSYASIGDEAPGWITADSVRVAEYYYIEEQEAWSVRIMGGDGVWEDEIEERDGLWYDKAQLESMDAGALQPELVLPIPVELDEAGELIKRKSVRQQPKWAKINAVEILDGDKGDDIAGNTKGRDIPGQYIPLIMVSGIERVIKGQRRLAGMVRTARDIQRIYNYLASKFVETVALSPKSPFIIAAGQVEKYKKIWDTLNEENWPYLMYDPIAINQQNVPPPQRQAVEPPVLALLQGLSTFDNMMKAAFNIYDPSLGNAKSDQSGRAIAGLQSQSDAGNMNWGDNMGRARMHCGDVILEMIPVVYDAARIITINRADENEEVQINQEFADKDGNVKNYDMAVGKYSCTVSQGQYASQRQQAAASLTDIAKNVPQTALALLPLILDNMDTPMAKEAAAIVKRMLPPEMQEPGSPEQAQAELQAFKQQHQLLVQALERANQVIQTKQLDTASREYIAGLQAQAQIAVAGMKIGSAQGMAMAAQEFQRITKLLDQNHERLQAEQAQAHDVGLEAMKQGAPKPEGAA